MAGMPNTPDPMMLPKSRAQMLNPLTGRYVKIDTDTGRIIDTKKSPGPYKGIRDLTRSK